MSVLERFLSSVVERITTVCAVLRIVKELVGGPAQVSFPDSHCGEGVWERDWQQLGWSCYDRNV